MLLNFPFSNMQPVKNTHLTGELALPKCFLIFDVCLWQISTSVTLATDVFISSHFSPLFKWCFTIFEIKTFSQLQRANY